MRCSKYGLVGCILNGCKLLGSIGRFIRGVLTVHRSVGDLEILNACSLILCGDRNDHITFVEAKGYRLKHLVDNRGGVFDRYVRRDVLVDYKAVCLLRHSISGKIGVVEGDIINTILGKINLGFVSVSGHLRPVRFIFKECKIVVSQIGIRIGQFNVRASNVGN